MIYIKDDFEVKMSPNESLDAFIEVKVYYRKPGSQAIVEKDPTIVDTTNNKVIYRVPAADNTIDGKWTFWCRVTNSDNKVATSTPVIVQVSKP